MNTTKLRVVPRFVVTGLLAILLSAACAPAAATASPAAVAPVSTEAPAAATAPATEAPASTEAPAAAEATAIIPVTNCDTLLPADACDKDWEGRIEYAPLASLPTVDCTETLLAGGQCAARLYTNNGQQFIIRIEGADPAVINDYLNNTRIYFEVHQAGVLPSAIPDLPSLGTILVETAVKVTGSSEQDLIAKRDELSRERDSVTFADVLIAITDDTTIPDHVLEAANAQAETVYAAAGADTRTIAEDMKALMYEPGASVLVDQASLPGDDSGYQNLLMNNPASLAVIFDWTSVPKEQAEELWTIWYAVDPPIPAKESPSSNFQTGVGKYAWVYYKAKCGVYSAYTKITATSGSMTDYFWRQSPWLNLPSRTASISGIAAPPSVYHSSYPAKVTYDTQVQGGYQGGQYYLYGGWVQGSSCQ